MNLRRVLKLSFVIAGAGLLLASAGWGRDAALGFAAGSVFSMFNFRALHRVVSTIGTAEAPSARGSAIFFALRYLLLLAAGYVIVRVSETSLRAAIIGLFVSIAAVILASLYELYEGT